MSALLHPVGPEKASTYWMRRGVALAALVLVVVLLWSFVGSLSSHNAPSASNTPSPSLAGSANGASAAASSTGSTMATPAPSSGSVASGSASPAGASAGPSPTPACDPTLVTVKLTGTTPVKSGSTTGLAVNLVNNSGHTCSIDFGVSTFRLTITSGSDRIWSTADCPRWGLTGSVKVIPGGAYAHVFLWPTLRSASGCQLRSQTLSGGTYVAQASLDSGSGAVFVMTLA